MLRIGVSVPMGLVVVAAAVAAAVRPYLDVVVRMGVVVATAGKPCLGVIVRMDMVVATGVVVAAAAVVP